VSEQASLTPTIVPGLDYKYYDVPETLRKAVSRAAALGVTFLTIHGPRVLIEGALQGKGASNLKLFTVTVLTSLDSIPEDKRMAVRNNGGGHANHTLFWEIMGPNGGGDPSGALGDAIADTFGSVADLKAAVNDGGVKRFGSGWTWLIWDGTGLAVKSTPNQDTPVMDGDAPLLGIDVWEHAYYLKYQNRRADYLAAFWNVVNWSAASARFKP
jgi:Fe-Mn family superoxide dismutase